MKFNWGIFAFSLFGVFVVFMLTMVFFASKQNNELVTENYYEKELEFKTILEKKNQANNLTEKVIFNIDADNLNLIFPKEIVGEISGEIVFYKPSNQTADKTIVFNTKNNIQQFKLTLFEKGMYRVKIDWNASEKEYYNELDVVIP
ncbi:MAG TPA: FixH family protein [Vicingus sp.]|jgi:hypothetical protein|nr:FixH family protein [Flavobacteriales bacterium]HRN42370.1 FixH family protein [Vicingus sp.]